MTTFQHALEQHPAPRRLGDIALRFEPSMLIGETKAPHRSLWPTVAWVVGVAATLFAVVSLIEAAEILGSIALLVLAAGGFSAAVWLERIDRRRRAFIVNFTTSSLRLDFVTPIAGQPQTTIVHFDGIRAVEFYEQADGLTVLTVDFVTRPESSAVLREVLVASIVADELTEARRLQRVLCGAFGLGAIPASSPWLEASPDEGS